jgi:hypothetical protein
MSMAEQRLEQGVLGHNRLGERDIGSTYKLSNMRIDLRAPSPKETQRFIQDDIVKDWSLLTWKDVGRPFRVENYASGKRLWEEQNGDRMPVPVSWQKFNRSFHEWFVKDVPSEQKRVRNELLKAFASFHWGEVPSLLAELQQLALWNLTHRVQDAIWDPRGKRALFQGLDVERPRILFLGAADGYEAMQLYAMYPGGEAVLVDYDEFCMTDRFGKFPEYYPFLGTNPSTGGHKVWYKDEMNLSFLVEDIRNLPFGQEFDIVISVGLIEHFPDEYKPEALDFHRRFLKPGGYAILTTPRLQWKSRLFYHVMAEAMNYTYRELMTVQQMGLYVYENGFEILRHGIIKAHNGIVARPR